MLRGIKIWTPKAFTLEPYITSLNLVCNYTSAKSATNSQQLPRLPVPKLDDTLRKFLKSVQPFLNDEESVKTSGLIKQFNSNMGVGPKLQELLVQHATKHQNWLEEWWINTAYLEYRDPVVVFSSPGLVYPIQKFRNESDQLEYAAKTLLAALEYKSMIDKDEIPVEMMGKNPLDMCQYKKIFGTCRIPHEKRDKLSYNDSKYVTVIHNNHLFHLDLWGSDGKKLSQQQIIEALKTIKKLSCNPNNEGVGILSSENRDTWAKAYELLSKEAVNRESLLDIERSLAVLCLDRAVGVHDARSDWQRRTLAAAQTIHGGGAASNGANRWFDKTIQFIVGEDGVTGLTYEHSPAEGQPIAVMTDFIINSINKGSSKAESSASPKNPIKLKFKISDEVSQMIEAAKTNLDKLVDDLELNCFKYDKYGKNFIKSHKFSPDSYLQMAMQYAFYRLHQTPGAHYESAATRMFAGGRTETIRSCSPESIEFAKAMLDTKADPKLKMQTMSKAISAHKDYTVQALQGLGVDRHLLGLKLIAKENGIEVPELYSDAGYVRSAHMRISTSQVACKSDGFMCYAPLVADGYATCYNPRDLDINFATAAFRRHPDTGCEPYRRALEQSLQDMHDLLLLNTKSKL
ncbi:carnitine O-acetyltransferase-like [Leptidea sinapis]|uniref:carnitine O-acetyltransferase-like n=1 Tax=Leptidea sinapis TaxID=189913 RepID=UPI002122E072|nr:carnitine O-acetyltransferase-like [Leptidea sinapis]XP_050675778.1 carnitine O-acetyltransferase-like [Leptidea sinapis]XP_050675779.1 carnitine O-acetyltransferase-like [Leptidea sinapis]